jgi:homoserine kinase
VKDQVLIRVPATTANLGPGFDCIGAALDLYNRFAFRPASGGLSIRYRGTDHVALGKDNLVYRAFSRAFEMLSKPVPAVEIDLELNVPLSRGLGSSATAIVGGLLGANALGELNLAADTILQMAIAIEGHPDNVVPALLGSCQLCVQASQGRWVITPVEWVETIQLVAVVPNFKLSTQMARDILPKSVSLADAIFTTSHLGLLIQALQTGNGEWLQAALQDRLHQPYRCELITGFKAIQLAAQAAGAYGVVISGAGPTLLAFCAADTRQQVGAAMVAAWKQLEVEAEAKFVQLDRQGGQVLQEG